MKHTVQELMDAYDLPIGSKLDMSNFDFGVGDIVTVYDKNNVKWYEIKIKENKQAVVTRLFVRKG